MPAQPDFLGALRRYWGYQSFRPLQEAVAASLLEGHDVCVVMPTGGGKSLCYQLPAAILNTQTAVVVSPLLALMQDQAAQLAQIGIPSAVLNSTLSAAEQAHVMARACQGCYRLLYLSPERLARSETSAWLGRVPVSFFAVDEAHCISEWGHEFRPEYRLLGSLRRDFPDRPIAAFTASATRRVRHDIVDQLQLRDPHKYIASFHRPNLRYLVHQCDGEKQPDLLLRALRKHEGANVIVYAPTIARVEQTADFLEDRGVPAVAYHGQMNSGMRRRNQERWTSDEVRVLVGTIAFGLGIDKAAVRAVIHLSLPKSIEQYYQEAGRAGRDGLPADCLLLWRKRDAGLLAHFIEEVADPGERERAWQRYHAIRRFVESRTCRHRQICLHFGQNVNWSSCAACDVCDPEADWLAPAALRPCEEAAAPLAPERRDRRAGRKHATESGATGIDSELREYLRQWRRATAEAQGTPAFVVMHDASLDDLCRQRPRSIAELRGVHGFGERKTARYGGEILDLLDRFRKGARAAPAPESKPKPAEETKRMLAQGLNFDQIAEARGRRRSTVIELAAQMVARGELEFDSSWIGPGRQAVIEAVCARLGSDRLKALKDALPPEIAFEEIRLVVARWRREQERQ
ncbi:MAG TPA: RecQ family ATP-dependent DNA helicase [Candidatus Acidoferrales bacterium]|nr:RecQ family ATP-dependent DNA helicase [Candidatus Acidoferrales bacterium]